VAVSIARDIITVIVDGNDCDRRTAVNVQELRQRSCTD
jgi:hypothetical protein